MPFGFLLFLPVHGDSLSRSLRAVGDSLTNIGGCHFLSLFLYERGVATVAAVGLFPLLFLVIDRYLSSCMYTTTSSTTAYVCVFGKSLEGPFG